MEQTRVPWRHLAQKVHRFCEYSLTRQQWFRKLLTPRERPIMQRVIFMKERDERPGVRQDKATHFPKSSRCLRLVDKSRGPLRPRFSNKSLLRSYSDGLLFGAASEIINSSASRNRVDGLVCLLLAAARSRAFSSFDTFIESVSVIIKGSQLVSNDNYQRESCARLLTGKRAGNHCSRSLIKDILA